MTATALISRAGRAIVRDGETFYVLTADNPSLRPADATHWMHLRGLHPDAELLMAGKHPFPEVKARMLAAWREQLGLDLLLIVLGQNDDAAFRTETASALEKLLIGEPALSQTLRAILLSSKAPAEAEFPGAIACAKVAGAERVQELLSDISAAGSVISTVLTALRNALATLPTPPEQAAAMTAVQCFYIVGRAVIALRNPAPSTWERFRAWCSAHLAPALVESWLSQLEKDRVPTKGPIPASAYPRVKAPPWVPGRRDHQPAAA
jgi:hypothetical protein